MDKDFASRIQKMKNVVSELDGTIINPEARGHFLSEPKKHIQNLEQFVTQASTPASKGLLELALVLAEEQLVWVKNLVKEYGPSIRITGE